MNTEYKKLGWFKELICKLFHSPVKLNFIFEDKITTEFIYQYECLKCECQFLAASPSKFRMYNNFDLLKNYEKIDSN